MRLDIFLVENKFCETRAKAQSLIKMGGVFVDDVCILKNGFDVCEGAKIEIKNLCPYVSRAGLKLEGACKDFGISMEGKTVLDIGSSTGGFTDYCLKNGAKKVYSVDVGTNQLHHSLRENKKVVVMENTDIRTLTKNDIEDVDFIVCDVSFISLTKISDKISEFLEGDCQGIILVKPQFECGKKIAKNFRGVIKDEKIHKIVLENIKTDFKNKGICVEKMSTSKIKGGDGNVEYCLLIKKNRQ